MARKKTSTRPRKRSAKRRKSTGVVERVVLALAVTMVTGAVLAAVFHLVTHNGRPRMAPFAEAPAHLRSDLLYLSYLDSLAREHRATPAVLSGDGLLARRVAHAAGVPTTDMTEWGLNAPAEPGFDPLSAMFREFHRRGRLVLPVDDAALWTHLRDRRVHPGFLVFGRSPAIARGIDFCAIVTATNIAQPQYSLLLYRDPATGRLVHGTLQDLPQIAYFGSGRPGTDLADVYRTWFRLQDQRDKKPLFPH